MKLPKTYSINRTPRKPAVKMRCFCGVEYLASHYNLANGWYVPHNVLEPLPTDLNNI